MNMLSGVLRAGRRARSQIDGKPVRFANPREAQAAGIATIFQELDLVPSLDVAANLFLGRELTRAGRARPRGDARARRASGSTRSSSTSTSTSPVGELSIGQRQIVAIVKALSYASRILIMDEPTAALTVGEVERLFDIMRELAARGVGIVYISHRLEEVPRVADRVTVMRDGRVAGDHRADAPQAELVRAARRPAARRALSRARRRRSAAACCVSSDAASARDRERAGWQAPRDVSLDVHAGEIVGLAGIMGAGRTELLSALYGTGLRRRWAGDRRDRRRAGQARPRSARRAAPGSPSSPTTGAAAA